MSRKRRKRRKARSKFLNGILITFCLVSSLVLGFFLGAAVDAIAQKITYKPSNVNYVLEEKQETFEMHVTQIKHGKGEERSYVVSFSNVENEKDKFSANLSQSEYETLCKNEQDTINGTVYLLKLEISSPFKFIMGTTVTLNLYRYSFLGEETFSTQEIESICEQFANIAYNYAKSKSWGDFAALRAKYAPNKNNCHKDFGSNWLR